MWKVMVHILTVYLYKQDTEKLKLLEHKSVYIRLPASKHTPTFSLPSHNNEPFLFLRGQYSFSFITSVINLPPLKDLIEFALTNLCPYNCDESMYDVA